MNPSPRNAKSETWNSELRTLKPYLTHTFNLDDPAMVSIIDELPLWSAPFGLMLLDAVPLKPHTCALDLGCGTGFPLIELAQRLGPSCLVVGLDPWERAVERVHLKIRTLGLETASVIKAAGERMPFHDGTFDLIVSNNGINNVEDPETVLRECFRTSRPGARMIVTVNLPGTMIEFYEVFEGVLKDLGTESEVRGMHAHIYSKRKPLLETEALLDRTGFGVRKTTENSFAWRFVDGTAMLNHAVIRFAFMDPWRGIVAPGDVERVFEELENRLNLLSSEKGELALTIPYACIEAVRE